MIKTRLFMTAVIVVAAIAFAFQNFSLSQKDEPWNEEQLMAPAALADVLENEPKEEWPVIVAVNPDGMFALPYEGGIPGSKWFGPAEDEENLDRLENYLQKLNKDEEVVVYCGCCPFTMCPNVRPAFSLLKDMGFKNHKLLNLSQNLKDDWIKKGYPMKG